MADREILDRLDRHLAVSNKHMSRGHELMMCGNELMMCGNELMGEVMRELSENRRERRDLRDFLREMTRRNERVTQELVTEISAGRKVLIDVHEESLAQRKAILALIDELREHGLGGRG